MTAEQLLSIKRRIESLRSEQSKAEGAYQQTMKDIEREFGCKTLPDAEKLSKQLQQQATEEKTEADEAFIAFGQKHEAVLEPS